MRKRHRLCLALAVASLQAACTSIGTLERSTDGNIDSQTASGTTAGGGDLTVYLELMRAVIEGDPLSQAATVRQVAEAVDIAPTTTNRLEYALVMSVPGHPGSDAAEAQRRLSALLAAGDALLPAERLLATVQLRDVEQRLVLEVAAADLRTELADATASNDAAAAQQIQELIEQNRRLQSELDDATSKLNAITTIEQSVRELEDGTD